ncbi:MAG: hypothetical protein IJ748_02485 [Bacteroidales bacterium]|nr:hypothetical protein [Bacteroidales bacterium]
MLDFFDRDSFVSGFFLSACLNVAGAVLIGFILWLFKMDVLLNLKIFLFSVAPSILLIRRQVSNEKMQAFRGSVLSLIVCLAGLIISFLKMNIFDNPFSGTINL